MKRQSQVKSSEIHRKSQRQCKLCVRGFVDATTFPETIRFRQFVSVEFDLNCYVNKYRCVVCYCELVLLSVRRFTLTKLVSSLSCTEELMC